ncbi:MAG TPA: helix-turn-helix transcriptional regulator [Candidatus Saccharimonadales bacterium]|nr:helix-turn-helix transcriptional regulator [Candidatus Saccharimonadales bacterium]
MQTPQIHEATFECATSKLAFSSTAPGELKPNVPYQAELISIADIGGHLKTMRGAMKRAEFARQCGLSKPTISDVECERVIPYLETADKIYGKLGGGLLCLAISSVDLDASKKVLYIAGPDDQIAIKPWFVEKYKTQGKTGSYLAERAEIPYNNLKAYEASEVQRHVRPLVLEQYISGMLGMQLEFCGIRGAV